MKLEAVILDLEGTIADTEEIHRQAYNAAFREMALGWEWVPHRYAKLLAISGGPTRIRAFIETLDVDVAEAKRLRGIVPLVHATKTRIYGELIAQTGARLRPGVERLLEEARGAGLRIGVVSTTSSTNAQKLLHAQLGAEGFGYIDALASADLVKRPKPAPELYRYVLGLLRRTPEQCIAIEDSANGVRAARAAGLAVIATPTHWTAAQDFDRAHYRFPSLEELGLAELRTLHANAPRDA